VNAFLPSVPALSSSLFKAAARRCFLPEKVPALTIRSTGIEIGQEAFIAGEPLPEYFGPRTPLMPMTAGRVGRRPLSLRMGASSRSARGARAS
jgi:hypothetical protein